MANKNIRGITIEIGGDTTKLGKALENSEKKSRSLQTELREIQQSLKFNPANVEILNQKQTVLTQSIAETSDKLDILREAERQVIEQFERGEVAEEQVRALQREILKAENQLESMTNELKSTDKAIQDLADGTDEARENTQEYKESLEKANQELEDFKGKASDAFQVIGAGVGALGAGAVATAGYAVNLTNEFDKAFNILQTQTGATAEEMERLEESANNIYKSNLGENMEDVARSMATVKTQTNLVGQELEDVTSYALLMRDTFDFEVNESIRGANSLMDQFGITAEEAYTLIAQGAQKGLNQNGDLMDVINEYSLQFSTAGYNAEDMFNMLANGAESGTWSVDKLGDAMKEFNIRASDGTVAEALKENAELLGLSTKEAESLSEEIKWGNTEAYDTLIAKLKDVDDYTQQYQLGVAMFGTMWEDLGEDAVYALFNTQGAISKTSDALENINDIRYDDLGSALGGLKRSLETDVIDPLGEELKPVVEDAIGYVKENGPAIKDVLSNIVTSIGNFVKMIVDNKDVIISAIVAIGTGLLVWNIVGVITSVVGVITTLFTAIKNGVPIMKALNLAMNANPIGIIITLIAGLVAGFIALWNTSEEFRAFWLGLWENIKNIVGIAVDSVVSFFSSAWSMISEAWSGVTEWFSGVASAISGFFSSAWDTIVSIWSGVVAWFSGIWSGIVEVFSPAIEWFSALFTSIYDTLASIIQVVIVLVTGTWEAIKAIFSVVYAWFNTTVIQPVKNAFSTLWTIVSNLASSAWNGIKTIWSVVSGWFRSTIIDPISGFFSSMWDKLKSGASSAWSGIKSVFSGVTSWFKTQFTNAWTAVKNVFSTGGKIFSGITEGITSAFTKVVNAIIRGINKVIATPFNAINGVLDTIRSVSIAKIKPFSGLPSISVPKIPQLWRGGILKKGQTGYLEGDGAEAVVPLEKETGWINKIAQKMNNSLDSNPSRSSVALASKMDEMIKTIKALKSTIVLDTGVLVGETINQIDTQLGNNYSLRERGI